ncbi:SRPBCC family protein [Gordonia phthalatica]|uniref:Polyketide cyclase n=1 Tax=Gordonia phthalatica TaxID=1136941 RepID=A0A0N9N2N1_9ACTN|nr:SRPBCC family protein [Gordonia phthalatica]ALG84904.1 hypothetical protein ACH46_10865 [Gordonia phthalatica]
MKYTISIEIDRPRNKVVELLSDPAQMPKWLRGLISHEPIEGVHGQLGAVSHVVFQTGKQQMEATETVTRVDPIDPQPAPATTAVRYEREIAAQGMWQAQRDRLIDAGPNRTLWESESEFRFDGLVMRLFGLLIPSVFRKQSRRHMEDFKAFAEDGADVRDETS